MVNSMGCVLMWLMMKFVSVWLVLEMIKKVVISRFSFE